MKKYMVFPRYILWGLLILALSACGNKETVTGLNVNQTKSVTDVLAEGMAEEDEKKKNLSLQEGNKPDLDENNAENPNGVSAGENGLKSESDSGNETETWGVIYGESESETIGLNESVSENRTMESEKISEKTDGIDVDLTEMSSTIVFAEVYNMMMDPMSYIGKTVRMNGSFAIYHDDEKNKDHYACIIRDATACCEQGVEFMFGDGYTFPDDYPKEGEEISVTGVFRTYKDGEYTYWALMDSEKN